MRKILDKVKKHILLFAQRFTGFSPLTLAHWSWLFAPFNSQRDVAEILLRAQGYQMVHPSQRFLYRRFKRAVTEQKQFALHKFQLIALGCTPLKTSHGRLLTIRVRAYRSCSNYLFELVDEKGRKFYEYVPVYFLVYSFGTDSIVDGYLDRARTTSVFRVVDYAKTASEFRDELSSLTQMVKLLDAQMRKPAGQAQQAWQHTVPSVQ